MAITLTLKNTTGADISILDASSVIVPAGGSDTYLDSNIMVQLAHSTILQGLVLGGQIVVNDGASDLIPVVGLQYLAQLWTQQGFGNVSQTISLYQFQLGSALDAVQLPLLNCGIEVVNIVKTITFFRGRRGTPGTSGTTTAQLELNGVAIGGAVLSWVPGDGAFALKTVAITVTLAEGDRLSFRLTSAEAGGEDLFLEAD